MNDFIFKWKNAQVIEAVSSASEKALMEGAEIVLEDARRHCPVEKYGRSGEGRKKHIPGSLRKSGRIVKYSKPDVIGVFIIFGGSGYIVDGVDVYYGSFVELGTPGTVYHNGKRKNEPRIAIKAHAFMRPSLKKNRRRVLSRFRGIVQ